MKPVNRWMMAFMFLAALCIVGWTGYGQGQNSSRKNWEYAHTDNPTLENLNKLGEQGWELVSVDQGHAYFRRAK